jgi:hypothetical protein
MTGVLTLQASAAGLKDAAGSAGVNGNVLTINTSGYPVWTAPAASGLTSVGLTDSTGLFTVTGSPLTSNGSITLSAFATKTANYVFAGPVSGAAAAPAFRALVNADIPTTLSSMVEVDVDTIKLNHTTKDIVLSRSAAASLAVTGSPNVTGSIQTTQLATPSAPTVTPTGGSGTTWGYKIIARDSLGKSIASAEGTGSGGATLSVSVYNTITWTAVAGAVSYDVYRSTVGTSPTTKGVIGNVLADATLTFTDNNVVGDATNAPTFNTTGNDASTSVTSQAGISYFWGGWPIGIGLAATSNAAIGAVNRLYFVLFYIPFSITITKATFYCNAVSGSASQYISVGLYDINQNIVANFKVNVSSGQSTGNKVTTIGATTIQPGFYYFGYTTNSTDATFGVLSVGGNNEVSLLNQNGTRHGYTTSGATSGGILPTTMPTLSTLGSAQAFPLTLFEP